MTLSAVIVGATGLVGRAAVERIASDADCGRVIVLARKPAPAALAAKIAWRVVDFDDPQTYAQVEADAPDAVLCALGTTNKQTPERALYRKIEHDYPLALARAIAPRGRFCYVSAVGASTKASSFYLRLKGEVEAALSDAGLAAVHVLRPSFLIGARGEARTVESVLTGAFKASGPLFAGPLSRYRAISAADVARAMLALAKRPDPGTHIHHYREILRALS